MTLINDYEIRDDKIWIENLDAERTEAEVNDFFTFLAVKYPSQKWIVCGDSIVIPSATHPVCEILNADQFHERFRGDSFNDFLLEYVNEADLKWEEQWFPPQVDDAQEDAWRDFRNQCGV